MRGCKGPFKKQSRIQNKIPKKLRFRKNDIIYLSCQDERQSEKY